MNVNMNIKKTIREVEAGGMRQIEMGPGINPASFRTFAAELNREAGWTKYRINVNSVLGLMTIINCEKKSC